MPIPKPNGQDRTSSSMSFMLKDGTEVTIAGTKEMTIFRELIAHRGTFITKVELKRCLRTSEDWTVHQPMNSIRKQLNEQTDGQAGAFLVGRRGEGYCWDESELPT